LWLNAPPGSQEQHVRAEPEHFFVPPYVGPRGWVGVLLDHGINWKRVAALVREAYEKAAPAELRARVGGTPALKGPGKPLSASQIDPMRSRRGRAVLNSLRKICLLLPESREERQFGHPVWQAGKKTFALARHDGERITLGFWVGLEQQGLLISDPRYQIPPYMGHNGWIALDVTAHGDWKEVEALAVYSYRHFALKRMLLRLPPPKT